MNQLWAIMEFPPTLAMGSLPTITFTRAPAIKGRGANDINNLILHKSRPNQHRHISALIHFSHSANHAPFLENIVLNKTFSAILAARSRRNAPILPGGRE